MTPRLTQLLRSYADGAIDAGALQVELMDYGYEIEAVPVEDRQALLTIENLLFAFTAGHLQEDDVRMTVLEKFGPAPVVATRVHVSFGPLDQQVEFPLIESSTSAPALRLKVAA